MHDNHNPAFICRHCLDDGQPILYVVHDWNGDWQFLCGGNNHVSEESGAIIRRSCLWERDKSLEGIETLPVGHEAERASSGDRKWEVAALPPEEDLT
jgi:hypothetical protein